MCGYTPFSLLLALLVGCGGSQRQTSIDPVEDSLQSPNVEAPLKTQAPTPSTTIKIVPLTLFVDQVPSDTLFQYSLAPNGDVIVTVKATDGEGSAVWYNLSPDGSVRDRDGEPYAKVDQDGEVTYADGYSSGGPLVVNKDGRVTEGGETTIEFDTSGKTSLVTMGGEPMFRYEGPPEGRQAAGLILALFWMRMTIGL